MFSIFELSMSKFDHSSSGNFLATLQEWATPGKGRVPLDTWVGFTEQQRSDECFARRMNNRASVSFAQTIVSEITNFLYLWTCDDRATSKGVLQ
jgi:hypothetical protein